MAKIKLKERIRQGVFFLDGAMGTELMARNIAPAECNEYLNISCPQVIYEIHKSYFGAGSDAVLTNTFGGNMISLGRSGFAQRVDEFNLAAAKLARQAAGEEKYVLGDIGPCGDFLEPLGTVKRQDLFAAFAAQAAALDKGEVDGFVIETMTAIEEVEVAVIAVRSVCDKPVFVSMAFDPAPNAQRTMMGVSPEQMVERLLPLNVDAVGFNCGTLDMAGYIRLVEAFAELLKGTGLILLAEPNAGRPLLIDEKAVFSLSPADFACAAESIYKAGARILGGCCGTTPAHIAAMTKIIVL